MPYIINGGNKLRGEIQLQGAKHSYAAIMIGAVLAGSNATLTNFPNITDATNMVALLAEFGIKCKKTKNTMLVMGGRYSIEKNDKISISGKHVKLLRDSFYILALAPLFKTLVMPITFGGCKLGIRPIDEQLDLLRTFGFTIDFINRKKIKIIRKKKYKDLLCIHLKKKSVSTTKLAILIGSYINKNIVIKNIPHDPDLIDLVEFLKKTGVPIEITSDKILIKKVLYKSKKTITHKIIPDRMEAVSFICAALVTKSRIKIMNFDLTQLGDAKKILEKMGVKFSILSNNDLIISCKDRIKKANLKTGYFPCLSTDMQPIIVTALCLANGESKVQETIFNNARWNYLKELGKMGARYSIQDKYLNVYPVEKFKGTTVHGMDIRATAALIIAGLAAENTTKVYGEKHLLRAYDKFTEKLTQLGADIKEKSW